VILHIVAKVGNFHQHPVNIKGVHLLVDVIAIAHTLNLSSQLIWLICVRNGCCVAVKGMTFSQEALTPAKDFLTG
jgi:hypothetical protein